MISCVAVPLACHRGKIKDVGNDDFPLQICEGLEVGGLTAGRVLRYDLRRQKAWRSNSSLCGRRFVHFQRVAETMVRLTAVLIRRSPQYFNPVRQRELDLRGNKIAVIENLGATEDQFDCIDLSDNELVKLENFPYLRRLNTLLINNNRITRINPSIGEFLPKLETLVLTNNRLVNLVDLDPLAALVNLQTLSLLDNIVTKKPNYRSYVISKLKKLRLLDFKKIKQKERLEAEKQFESKEAEEEAKKEPAKTFTVGEVPTVPEVPCEEQAPKVVAPTPEQILAIKAAIANSQTLEEVARLEKALKSGQLPADLKISDDEMKIDPAATEVDEKMHTEDQKEDRKEDQEHEKDQRKEDEKEVRKEDEKEDDKEETEDLHEVSENSVDNKENTPMEEKRFPLAICRENQHRLLSPLLSLNV